MFSHPNILQGQSKNPNIQKLTPPGAIAAFANFLPEIMELLGNRPKYAGSYKVTNQSYFS